MKLFYKLNINFNCADVFVDKSWMEIFHENDFQSVFGFYCDKFEEVFRAS